MSCAQKTFPQPVLWWRSFMAVAQLSSTCVCLSSSPLSMPYTCVMSTLPSPCIHVSSMLLLPAPCLCSITGWAAGSGPVWWADLLEAHTQCLSTHNVRDIDCSLSMHPANLLPCVQVDCRLLRVVMLNLVRSTNLLGTCFFCGFSPHDMYPGALTGSTTPIS